ncbi:transcription factor TFIIIB component B''-like isoform X2 [Stegodyphus dumicola]|uniref:transcription factor TFIIIB component B''-like isoform X2 n=1 Tax=Stegodyphus dumicola TaxID=202533 RepID=UPI0015A88B73|nr:transcription factor TFIIIB component B''-like isoform X2 [Stegodyphus dumicola]
MLSLENSTPNSELIPQRQLCIPSKRTVPVTRARFEKARPNIKFSSKRTNEKPSRDKPAKEEVSQNIDNKVKNAKEFVQPENISNEAHVTENSLQSENIHDIADATGKSLQSENVHDTADGTEKSLQPEIISDVLNTTEKSLQSEPISSAVSPERCKAINENDCDVDNRLLSTVETSGLAQRTAKNSTVNNSVSIPQKNKTPANRSSNTEILKKVNEESSENRYLSVEKECVPVVASSENRIVKYPHLTSILNSPKKRPENKEVLKKKRKYAYAIPKKGATPPERSKMTMMDLIYYNPSSSPMQGRKTDDTSVSNSRQDELIEESNCAEDNGESSVQETIVHSTPLLILDENGEIDIEKSSLTVQRSIPETLSTETVRDDDTTYSSFRRRHSTWSIQETAKFYKALSLVGTDFGLMEKLLTNRTRRELKLKFKREEKQNLALVNKAMYESETFDIEALNDDSEIGSEFFESIEGIQNVMDCSASEVDTPDNSRSKQNEYIDKEKSLSTVNTPTENKQLLTDSSVAGDEKSNDSSVTGDENLEEAATTENGALHTGRKRKAKVLGDDFVDVDVIIEDDDVSCELRSSPVPPSKSPTPCAKPTNVKHKKQNYQKHDSLIDYNGDCTALLNSSSQNVADTSDSAVFTVLSTCNSEATEEPCVISLTDSELGIVTNVVANEVVVESGKKNRRRNRQKPNVTEAQKRRMPVINTYKTVLPSSRIYTPAEEYPVYEEKHPKFSPEKNLRCYSRSKFLPNTQDLPIPFSQISDLNENECTVPCNSQDQALLVNLNTCDSVTASSSTDESNPGTGTAMIIVPSDQNIYTSNSVAASSNADDSNPGTGTAMIIVPDDQNMYTSNSVTASSNTDDSNLGTGAAMIIVPNDQNMYHVYMYNKPTAPSITLSPESLPHNRC